MSYSAKQAEQIRRLLSPEEITKLEAEQAASEERLRKAFGEPTPFDDATTLRTLKAEIQKSAPEERSAE